MQRWTNERIKALLEEIDKKGTPSKGHTAFAALMMIRDDYEAQLAQTWQPISTPTLREALEAEMCAYDETDGVYLVTVEDAIETVLRLCKRSE